MSFGRGLRDASLFLNTLPLSQYLGSSDESVSKVTADTDNQLKTIEATYNQNKQIVLDKILAQVIKVNPEMHINSLNPKGY